MKFVKPKFIIFALILITALIMSSGIYTLKSESGEKAVVTQFGKYLTTVEEAGLHWHIPIIQKVEIVKCDVVRSLELGYRHVGTQSDANPSFVTVDNESLMITGDENLVHTEIAVQYRINSAKDFLFNAEDSINSLKIAAESSVRRVVANHKLDDVLTDQKEMIQAEIREDLQSIVNEYGLGIDITKVSLQAVYAPPEVQEAFDDVIKAREDMNRYINEAKEKANEIIPAAEAAALEMVNKANAYKEKRISEAKGDVENFRQVLANYELGPRVTRTRMYLETMQEILPKAKIYIMNDKGETLRFLPLED
ncbi:MAG: FtsH protease activity modulator HflK [Clostridiaceae bacterium]|nr:FtsH protease activity modulator HflK [Clostridiaceae bacterium]